MKAMIIIISRVQLHKKKTFITLEEFQQVKQLFKCSYYVSRLPNLSDENNNEYKQEFTTKTGSLAIQIIK